MKRTTLLVALLVCVAIGRADVMTVGTTRHQGAFEGYADNLLRFRTLDGNLVEVYRTRVRSLTIEKPLPVTLVPRGKEDGAFRHLLGFTGGKFSLRHQGNNEEVAAMFVERITPARMAETHGQPLEREGKLDIAPLRARTDLTASQSAALRRYRAAQAAWDRFVSESSAMVTAMNRATGKQRDRMLDALRLRKADEQPLKRALEQARAALLAAIPPPWTGTQSTDDTPSERVAEGARLPELEADQVLILDVSALHTIPDLTRRQKHALGRYESAVKQYQSDPANATNTETLANAQGDLLAAFPDIKLVLD